MFERLGLTPRITLVFLLFASGLLVGLGLLASRSGNESLRAATISELLSTAIVKEDRIRDWVRGQAEDIETIAASPALRQATERLVAAPAGSAEAADARRALVRELAARRTASPGRHHLLGLLEPRGGRVIVATERQVEGMDSGKQAYFLRGREYTYVQPPYQSRLLLEPSMTVSTPVRGDNGTVVAVLVSWMGLDELNEVMRRRSGLNVTEEAFVVGADRRFITVPRLRPGTAVLRDTVNTDAVRECLAGSRGVRVAPDYRGREAVVAYRWLAQERMCLVVKQDLAEVLEPSRAFSRQLALFGGLMLLLASAVAYGLALSIVRPVNVLLEGVRRFSTDERTPNLPVRTDDVLGRLAAEFNSLAATIRKRQGELRYIAASLEETVIERTAELAASTARIRLLLDSTAEAIYGVDTEGRCTFANRACLDVLGVDDEADVLGRHMLDRLALDSGARGRDGRALVAAAHEADTPVRLDDLALSRRDGTWISLQLSAYPMVNAGTKVGTMVTFLDISERKRAQEELDRFFTLSLDMLAIASMDGYFRRLNPAWEKVLGYSAAELIARPFLEFVHPDDRGSTIAQTSGLAEGRSTTAFENRYLCKDGTYRWLLWQAAPSLEDGLIYAAASDITAIKESEAALLRGKEAAESGSRSKSEFLANMSHEIRTPLNGVLGTVDLLMGTPLNRSQRELAGLARASGETLLTIINDILDFAKIEAGKLSLESLPFDLLQTVEQVSGMTGLQAAGKQLDLVVRYPAAVPRYFIGDAGRIRQVLVNLLNNAIKFTERGHVLIDVALGSMEDGRANLVISIEDTGIGISPQQQVTLFEKFSQADASTTRRFGGTGLGLAISSQLVGLMGGRIEVESEVGKGSTFRLTLPFPIDPRPNPVEPAVPNDIRGTRVLIVDDNAVNRRVLEEQVAQWGMHGSARASAQEALDALRAAAAAGEPYSVAILDYQMPDIDGEMLGRAIRLDPALSDTALVMLTSLGHTDNSASLAQIGFSAYLTKPVRQSDLLNALRNACTGGTLASDPSVDPDADAGAPRPLPHAGTRALLVEDNATNRYVASLMLRGLGCSVDVASDGREALDRLNAGSYDLIFMDCEMPVMDGFEATAAIRARGDDKAGIPIVAVTAQAMQGDRERCLAAGMDDYITKPVQPESFRNALVRWAPNPGQGSGAPGEEQPADGASQAAVTVLDADVIRQLRELAEASDPALLEQIFDAFRNDSERRLVALRDAASAGDAAGVRAAAHAIKGASANVGATAMAATAKQLEAQGRTGDLAGIDSLIDRLQAEFAQVLAEIKRVRAD